MFYVYKIINNINGKVYIGKTSDISTRWRKHVNQALSDKLPSYYLHNSIAKYGPENFSIIELGQYHIEQDAFVAEAAFIKQYSSTNRSLGMNIAEGGQGPSGFKHSEKTKRHLSRVCSGWKHTEETKRKISKSLIGIKRSPETIEKMRQANLGKTLSDETKKKLSDIKRQTTKGEGNGFYGKTHSEETKQILRDKCAGTKSPRAKFSKEEVLDIRRMHNSGLTLSRIADKYKCGISTIHGIVKYKRYANIA